MIYNYYIIHQFVEPSDINLYDEYCVIRVVVVAPSIVPAEAEIVTVDAPVEVFLTRISAPLPTVDGFGKVIVKEPEAIIQESTDAVKADVALVTFLL